MCETKYMKEMRDVLVMRDCVCSQNNLYFFATGYSFPIRKNLLSDKTDILQMTSKRDFRDKAFDLEICVGRNLYVLEMGGEYFLRYNLDTYEANYYKIDCDYDADGNFAYMNAIGEKIYIFTRRERKLIIFDTKTETMRTIMYPYTEDSVYICGCVWKGGLFLFPQSGSYILEYMPTEDAWKVHHIEKVLDRCVHVVCYKDEMYILLVNGRILKWNIEENVINELDYNPQIYSKKNRVSRIVVIKDTAIILPSSGMDIGLVNLQDMKLSIYHDYPKDFMYDSWKSNWSKYYGYCETKNYYYFANRISNYMLVIDKTNLNISWMKLEISKEQKMKHFIERGNTVPEEAGMWDLFVRYDSKGNIRKSGQRKGTEIWKNVNNI